MTYLYFLVVTIFVHQTLFGVGAVDNRFARPIPVIEAQVLAADVRADVRDDVIFIRIHGVATIRERVPDPVSLRPAGTYAWIWKYGRIVSVMRVCVCVCVFVKHFLHAQYDDNGKCTN